MDDLFFSTILFIHVLKYILLLVTSTTTTTTTTTTNGYLRSEDVVTHPVHLPSAGVSVTQTARRLALPLQVLLLHHTAEREKNIFINFQTDFPG